MKKKVFIKQDGTIPGHRIIEELERRGGVDEDNNIGLGDSGVYYYISFVSVIIYSKSMGAASIELLIEQGYTELLYNKETDSFYEKSQRMVSAEAKENLLGNSGSLMNLPFGAYDSELYSYEWTIPEGYEAKVEDGKIIISKKKWHPSTHETFFMAVSMYDYPHFVVDECDWIGDYPDRVKLAHNNVFHTEEECQAFCNKLNNAIKDVIEERRQRNDNI